MKILLTISYKGTNFVGWQKQPKGRSVQGEIESALSFLLCEKIDIVGSGRTDAGVHALGQTAHFSSSSEKLFKNFVANKKFNAEKFVSALNANLPLDINISSAKKVKNNFHARYDAKQKTYMYVLGVGNNPVFSGLCGTIKKEPNLSLMKQASSYLLGEHNFKSFACAKTEVTDFVRTIYSIKISKKNTNQFVFEICGNGFLYNMVRIIVGTLVDVGLGKILPEEIKTILEAKDRTKAGKTAAAEGLYLKAVKY